MSTSDSGRPPEADEAAGRESGGAADPLAALLAHLRETFAAGRTYLSVLADEARLRLGRLVFRFFLTLFIVAFSFAIACMGGFYLVVGSVLGLEVLIGNRWGAYLIGGAICLLLSVALVGALLWHFKSVRMTRLRAKYADQLTEAP